MKKQDKLKEHKTKSGEPDPFDLQDAPPLNEHGEDWRQELWLLEQSTSATEFYSRLGRLIRNTAVFSDEDREFLAQQAEISWKKGRGRPREDDRNFEIFIQFVFDYEGSRNSAIEAIAKKYNLEFEAAQKAYSRAKKTNGQSLGIDRSQKTNKIDQKIMEKKNAG